MQSKSDFWLTLHKLADDLAKEGSDHDDRAKRLVSILEALPPVTIGVYFDDLESVTASLTTLLTQCKQR
jgi:hypothetical protein